MNRRALLQGSAALASLATLPRSVDAFWHGKVTNSGANNGHAMVELDNLNVWVNFPFINYARSASHVWSANAVTAGYDPYAYISPTTGYPTGMPPGTSVFQTSIGCYFVPGDTLVLTWDGDTGGSQGQCS